MVSAASSRSAELPTGTPAAPATVAMAGSPSGYGKSGRHARSPNSVDSIRRRRTRKCSFCCPELIHNDLGCCTNLIESGPISYTSPSNL